MLFLPICFLTKTTFVTCILTTIQKVLCLIKNHQPTTPKFNMDTILFYLKLGFEHIADIAAYDHYSFLVALCAVYKSQEWRTILWLVTAFTLGHCVHFNSSFV